MTRSWFSWRFKPSIRGKIMLAFTVLAAIAGGLGLFALDCVARSGDLAAHAYDKPLMAISHARLALADFSALELTIERGSDDTSRIAELENAIRADLGIAEDHAATATSSAAARTTAQAFEAWRAIRGAAPSVGQREAQYEKTARVLRGLDLLGELTAEDGAHDRQRSLALTRHFREVIILTTILMLLTGCLIATVVARVVVTPIEAASHAAERIAAGELDAVIPPGIIPGAHDELGRLLASMMLMRDNLLQLMDREIAARRSAQTQLADAIEGAGSGVALVGADGRVLIANSRIRQFFPGRRDAFAAGERVPAEIAEGLAHPTGEMRLEDGRCLRLTHRPSKEGGMVLIADDISFLKEREAALREARDEAEAAKRAKTDFLTNMSHELRTPLSAVIGFSEMIVKETLGPVGHPRYREFADDILHSGRHLMDVVSDILDIARARTGAIELRKRTVRPEAVMHAAMRVVRERARGANVALDTHIDEYLPAIEADAARLGQVLFNLLSNAIKFSSPGGTINAEVCRHPEGVAMRVRDTGAGMAARDIPRAMQPFVQVDTSLARRHGGTGLGLPLTKIFVELHGGRLEIESSVNVGTTVTVILPACVSGERKQCVAGASGPLARSPQTIRPDKIPIRSPARQTLATTPLVTAGGQAGSRETAVV